MPKCRNRESAKKAADEYAESYDCSHVEKNERSFRVKKGGKIDKIFSFPKEQNQLEPNSESLPAPVSQSIGS